MDVELIHATASGIEQRFVSAEADIEVGDDNTFQIRVEYTGYESYQMGDRIFVPGTEFGGRIGVIRSETESNVIMLGGYTWRGLLDKKIISPASGNNYYTASGDLGTITARILNNFVGGSIFTSAGAYGISTSYQFPRYCTVLAGLKKLYAKSGQKLVLYYDQTAGKVVVGPKPVRNMAMQVEMGSDNDLNFVAERKANGVNHLVCLGAGQLKNRLVVHLYVDGSGNISRKKTFYNDAEIVAKYENSQLTTVEDLVEQGTDELEGLMNYDMFEASIDDEAELTLNIGDIIGGRDYITGIYVEAPIARAIMTVEDGIGHIEYKLEGQS